MFGRSRQNNGDPPRYTRYISRVQMRWPFLVMAIISAIWAVATGVSSIRAVNDGGAAKEKVINVVIGILYFVVGGIAVYCVFVAVTQNLKLAQILRLAAPVGALIAVGATILRLVSHFVNKDSWISRCTRDYTGGTEYLGGGRTSTLTESEAASYCRDDWDRGTWRVIAWLVVVLIFAAIFTSSAMSYFKQLKSPTPATEQGFAMQPSAYGQQGNGYPPPPPNAGEQSWMVPPYPGPPASGSTPYEKGEFHPSAEWAQEQYPPPPGAPPGASRDGHAAQEEAWEQARRQGPTAHFTNGAPRPNRDSSEGTGYVVGNREEDEAWEQARTQGVTAHFTGHATGNNARREGTDI